MVADWLMGRLWDEDITTLHGRMKASMAIRMNQLILIAGVSARHQTKDCNVGSRMLFLVL
jgi:hypothetical protein